MISIVAVAPAGIVAPFEPVTDSDTVAVNRCPTRLLLVQTRELDARLSVVPAEIVPTARSVPPPVFRVTVLPLDVVDVVGAGAGARRTGVRTTVPPDRLVVVDRGAGACGAGAAGAGATVPAGMSFNAGCAAVSAFAICKSRLSAVSWASVSALFFSVHALNATASVIAIAATALLTVPDISVVSIFMWLLPKPLIPNSLDPSRGQSVCHL